MEPCSVERVSSFHDCNDDPFRINMLCHNNNVNVNNNGSSSSSSSSTDSKTSSEFMCICSSDVLDSWTQQWKYNRTLNSDKVHEIIDLIQTSKPNILDSVLHFFFDNHSNKYICFDGNHRRQALVILHKQYNIQLQVLCYVHTFTLGDLESVDNLIIEKFNIINKSTPIPNIYTSIHDSLIIHDKSLQENNFHKSVIMENVLRYYKNVYKSFYSLSSNPKRPNFNDTMFLDLCSELSFSSEEDLKQQLDSLNQKAKLPFDKDTSGLSSYIVHKCKQSQFFLFSRHSTLHYL